MNHSLGGRVGRRRAILFAAIGLVVSIAFVVFLWGWWISRSRFAAEHWLSEARAALQRKEFDRAEGFAGRIGEGDECWGRAQLVAGEAAMRGGRMNAAVEHYASIPRDGSKTAVLAVFSLAEVFRDLGRLSDAEQAYSYVLRCQPANAAAHERLAFLLGVTGRRWESLPHFTFLLRSGHATVEELVILGDLERPVEQGEYLNQCAKTAPDDVLVRLGLGAHALAEGRSSEARQILQEVVDQAPQLLAAQAMLGELLVDSEREVFQRWHQRLPPAAENYPDTWYVRGLWARRRGNLRAAARCFWETVRLFPTHRRGTYQLGQVLVALGETSGRDFAERSGKLFELGKALDDVLRSSGRHEPIVVRVTELMEETGRVWEACAWAVAADHAFPSATWPQSTLSRLSGLLYDDTPCMLDSANLALKYDLSRFPVPQDLIGRIEAKESAHPASQVRSSIRFEAASDAGIDFAYVNGADPSTKGARMFEQTGGGVAVIDFDGDGWPDLYFSQGAEWKHGWSQPVVSGETTDRLYRNLGGRAYVDVTRAALLTDHGFGQGCSVGDFDNDGFPDLYVANIGRNGLYRNNGDGTFTDVTDNIGLKEETWTASCVIVDLNADGLPDLFDVTYVTGPDVYEAVCNGHACSPKRFDGIPDRLHLNRGDGTFEFVPNATPDSNSKGLGVIAVDLYERGRPCLFVTNDQVPSHLLRNFASNDRFNIRLEEAGFASGLAFNEDGLAMAGMGIAADDVNGDGRIDLYVTTFKDESKILYLQDAPGLFVDATNAAGLRAPSLQFVGWGTQFLDADLDGEPDLVVANGHVDDYRGEGGDYHQRPQFFRNAGAGRFVELTSSDAGSFFQRKFLGRGLARLDWNRDGRMDFVVNNIAARASLVTNESSPVGRFLNVRLHATASARDAIGSVVRVVTGRRQWSKQLVAGDGYMASNERMLQFGLGDASSVTELHVNWPSGSTTTVRNLPVDVTVELVEGAPRGTLWRGSQPESLVVGPQP